MKKKIKTRLAQAEKVYNRAIQKLADEVRRKVVLPACRKYGLTFEVRLGRFLDAADKDNRCVIGYVFNQNGLRFSDYGSSYDCQAPKLRKVHDILDAAQIDGLPLGFAVRAVTEKDLVVHKFKRRERPRKNTNTLT